MELSPYKTQRYGWRPPLKSDKDIKLSFSQPVPLPLSVDLRIMCPAVYDQGQVGSCHDAFTEVLTDEGFKLFIDLTGDEKLATVNPDTSELIFERPTQILSFPFKGELYCVDKSNMNFKVTGNHKMLVRKWDENKRVLCNKYEFVEAKDLGWYSGLMNRIKWNGENVSTSYRLPGVPHKNIESQRFDRFIPMGAWLKFLGYYLAEGTMIKDSEKQKNKIQLAAPIGRKKEFIKEVMNELNIHYLELEDRITFSNKQVYYHLCELGLQYKKAGEKFVPKFVFELSSHYIKYLLQGHFEGDGNKYSHYTGSPRLANDLQLLIFLSGQESGIYIREPRDSVLADGRIIKAKLKQHRVSVRDEINLSIDRKGDIYKEYYNGIVYCAEVPTYHTLVTRRNGKILISGNCTGNAIAAAYEYDLIFQGLPLWRPSRLFIYYNERVIEGTTSVDAGASIKDGLASLNKVGVCTENTWIYDEDLVTVKPSVMAYDEAATRKIFNYKNIPDGDFYLMKQTLANKKPFVFGFTVYDSFESDEVARTGIMPASYNSGKVIGGHAVMAVGYDDAKEWVIVRNSWGSGWGDNGYFYMPYSYIQNSNLCSDIWVINHI